MSLKSSKEEALCKLFVGGLKRDTKEDGFREYFEQFGELTDCVIICDKNKVSRGFGFAAYKDPDVVDEVIIRKPHTIDGKVVDIRRATPKNQAGSGQPQQPRSSKLFIGGLHKDAVEDDIKEFFDNRFHKLGAVKEVDIKKNREGEARGFGFILFENPDVVERILLEDLNIEFNGKRCNVKAAIPKEAQVRGHPGDEPHGRRPPRDDFVHMRSGDRFDDRRPMPHRGGGMNEPYDYRGGSYEQHGGPYGYRPGAYSPPPPSHPEAYGGKPYGERLPPGEPMPPPPRGSGYDSYGERSYGAPPPHGRDAYGPPGSGPRGMPRGGPMGRMNGPPGRHPDVRNKPY